MRRCWSINAFTINCKLPSLNDWIKANRSNKYQGAKFKQEIEEVIGWSIKQALASKTLHKPQNAVILRFYWHERTKRRDADNIASAKKFILDALVKNGFTLGRQDYQWKHEPCLYGWKDGEAHYFVNDRTQSTVIEDKLDVNKLKKEEMKDLIKELLKEKEEEATTVIYEDKPLINTVHPTMKPIKLIAKLISNSSRKNEIVLDIFGGSGSTLIACEQLNRKCYTMELDPKYCDVIIKRWEELTGNTAVKI